MATLTRPSLRGARRSEAARLRRLALLLVAFLSGVNGLAGQRPSPSSPSSELPDFSAEWRWVDFGVESGLPSGPVEEMVEVDSVPWVRTPSGVAWYDGFQWRPAQADGEPLSGPATSLTQDGAGEVLVVQGGVVYRGGVEGFRRIPVSGVTAGQPIVRAVSARGGILFATTEGPPPVLWRVTNGHARPVDGLPLLTEGRALWLTDAGDAWIATKTDLREWTGSTWIARDTLPPASRLGSKVMENADGSGVAYVAGRTGPRGIFHFRGRGPFVPDPGEGDNVLWSGDVSATGLAIVAYETGDIRARVGGVWRSVQLPPSRGAGVRFVHIGASGDIWFGTGRGLHLYRRDRNRWRVQRLPFPASTNRVNAILLASDSSEWLATGGGVLHKGRDGKETWFRSAAGLALTALTGIAEASDGSIWVTSGSAFSGALRWNGHRWIRLGAAQGLDVGRVHKIFRGPGGALWMASLGRSDGSGAGLYRRLPDGRVEDMTQRLGLPVERAYAVAWGPDGTAWVAGASGLYRIRGDSASLFLLGSPAARHASLLWDVAVDDEGNPWVALNPSEAQGIATLDRNHQYRFLEPPGPEPSRRVWSLTFGHGALWLGTEGGVLAYRSGVWTRFDEAAGLPTENVWPLAWRGSSLLIGTKGGGLVTMSRSEADAPPPRIVVDRVTSEDHSARIRFAALSYWGELPASAVETRYRLDDERWQPWSTGRSVVFVGLASGVHRVQVQGKGLFGRLSTPAETTFEVPAPLVLRPVFAIPVGLLIAMLLVMGSMMVQRRRRHAAELREREQRLTALVETAPEAIGILDVDRNRFTDANENALQLVGVSRERIAEVDPLSLAPERQPDGTRSAEGFQEMVRQVLQGEPLLRPWTVLRAGGREIPCEIRLSRLPSEGGPLVRVSLVDIHERLAAEARRLELEEQLRQSQKLEAVGQLTGGVAHDFNNLLTVIRGNLELLDEEVELAGEARGLVISAVEATDRSARLTQRLLAFSRQQTLAPEPVDPKTLLEGLEELFRRSLEETVDLMLSIEAGVWPVLVDRPQLESTLLNLVINARDAMPGGGSIVIEAHNLPGGDPERPELAPGDYVRIRVVDDGLGMGPEVVSRAFDPFFTTKAVGHGTGLGLSMVYGFVAQSGGTVTIDSTRGEGTSVSLLLPRLETQET